MGWHGYGWGSARGYVSNRTVRIALGLLDCCRDPSDNWDLALVELQISYAVLS